MSKFSEEEIKKALDKIKKRHPEYATREMAMKYLEDTQEFAKMLIKKASKIKLKKSN